MIRPAAGGALWENWNFLAERDRKREWRETKVLLFSKILKSVFKWDLKVGFTQGERQFPEINPFERRSHTFKKGKPLVGKRNNQSLSGFYFGRLGSLFPEGANAAFDFKPCKLYCQTEISQNMRGNDFAIKCPLLVAVIFLKHRYINQKKHTMLTMRGKNSLSQKQTNKTASLIWWMFFKLSLETRIPLPNNNEKLHAPAQPHQPSIGCRPGRHGPSLQRTCLSFIPPLQDTKTLPSN